jgi:hypothetical protein
MANDDNKIRPNKGAMWFMQMQSDYFDSDFNNTFSGITCTAHGFLGFIKSYIASNWDKKTRLTEVKIKTKVLIATIDDERLSTVEDVTKISQSFMALGRLDSFQVSEDKKFLTFGIRKMLQWLDIFSKNELKKQERLENISACAESLNIPHGLNDSTRDEWIQYIFTLHYTLEKTRKKNGFTRIPEYDNYGEYDMNYDYIKGEYLKTTSKKQIHKGKDSKVKQITSFISNNRSNNKDTSNSLPKERRGVFDWKVIDSDSSMIHLRHTQKDDEYWITDETIINDQSLTLEEKYNKQIRKELERKTKS